MDGDRERENIYVGGTGETVIDYAWKQENNGGSVRKVEVGEYVHSDHHLVIMELEGEIERRRKGEKKISKGRGRWDERGMED